ncbi:family 18 glycoside hydrolase [Melampsora larici-populina 98AG31]|uniref:Family 18 glycoside hydrolase n=1 Tax=Melampsora larici-populina (strain 98AG31 / pathotype 3-4-7) TaxID=747676 RepID=F4RE69_MELLP|nr:family 18 glycoside hydrolase [Melampsora larici-populina 98AG31]EGG09040.1 family 18 glycoside hydrolase [Melampsora larici-populina 98AG31]
MKKMKVMKVISFLFQLSIPNLLLSSFSKAEEVQESTNIANNEILRIENPTNLANNENFRFESTTIVTTEVEITYTSDSSGFNPDEPCDCDSTTQTSVYASEFEKKCPGSKLGTRVVGYYAAYNDELQSIASIPFKNYTDLLFFTVSPLQNGTFDFDGPKSVWAKKAKEFVKRSKENCVRPILGTGGWNGSRFFSKLLSTPEKRKVYAENLMKLIDEFGFEGFDFSWIYPGKQGVGCNSISPNDLTNFSEFLALIKTGGKQPWISISGYIGGIAGPPGKDEKTIIAYKKIVASVDYVILMTYDVYGSWSDTTGPSAPLYDECNDADNKFSVQSAVKLYLSLSFQPKQLIISIANFGHGWKLKSNVIKGTKFPNGATSYIYQKHTKAIIPGGPSDSKPGGLDICGKPTNHTGTFQIKELLKLGMLSRDLSHGTGGFDRGFDQCSGVPYIISRAKKILITYDDVDSVKLKMKFILSSKLGGIAFFDTNGAIPEMIIAAKVLVENSNNPIGVENKTSNPSVKHLNT